MPMPEGALGRVAVAVSGGVDSLCALLLLQRAGYDLVALHGRFLPAPEPDPLPGLTAQCATLGIPLHCVDLREAFRREVMDVFARAYAAGHTPNPCALCNRTIKFGLLLDAARALGAERIATGHYARLLPPQHNSAGEDDAKDCGNGADRNCPPLFGGLAAAADQSKDQSYFLGLVPPKALARAIFPLAGRNKADNIRFVQEAGLTTPLSGESQDICFIPAEDAAYHALLQHLWQDLGIHVPGDGPILLAGQTEATGQKGGAAAALPSVGRHQGLWRYTEGQRKGLGIAHTEPLYVLRKKYAQNALIVGPRSLLGMKACRTGPANILAPLAMWPANPLVRLRHRQQCQPSTVRLTGNGAEQCMEIHLHEPCFPTAPGQVAALYDASGRMLAAAVVEEVF